MQGIFCFYGTWIVSLRHSSNVCVRNLPILDTFSKIWYNIRVNTRRGYTGKCKAMKRTFKLTLLVCLLLLANLFTLTSCFTDLPEDESTPFTTLTYTGKGSKVIKNIVVPNGKFIISGYAKADDDEKYPSSYFEVDLINSNGKKVVFWFEYLGSSQRTLEKASFFNGPINGGILEIQVDDYVSWTITIEAAG